MSAITAVIKGAIGAVKSGAAKVGAKTASAAKTTGAAIKANPKVATGVVAATTVGVGVGVIAKDIGKDASTASNSTPSDTMGKTPDAPIPVVSDYLSYKNKTKDGAASLTYPETLNNMMINPAHINFQFFDRNTSKKITSINLPMPDTVNNPNTISWDQGKDFGMLGNEAVKGLQAMSSGNDISTQSVQDKLQSMAERVKSLAFYTGVSKAVSELGGSNIDATDLMGATNGRIPNPYRTLLFRGVEFRSFSFVFNFVPFTEADCALIDSIITAFRAHSYPDYAGEKMFFTYPDECDISYYWESNKNKWLNNFKRAVCTGVNVDYAAAGHWSSMRNGFPNMIKLETKWSEVEIITKGDILKADKHGQRG